MRLLTRHVVFVLAVVLTSPAAGGQKLPVVAGTQLRCDQQNSDTPTHSGNLQFAWDFSLSGTSGNADLGLPVVSPEDGIVVYAQDYASGADAWGKCVVVKFANGQYGLFAHLEQIVVKKNESVKQGQVVGTLGNADGYYANGAHIHYQRQGGSTPTAASVSSSFDDGGNPVNGSVNESQNTGLFVSEFNTNGGAGAYGTQQNPFGTYAGVHWHYTYNGSNLYRSNNLPNNCYVQNWAGSTYNTCGIVYDALGGARRAYTVRNGFYHDSNNQGWNDIGGPNSTLGMPITNEYAFQGGARQDFQTGYLRYQQGHTPTEVWFNSYTAPGWTSSGWNTQFSYPMAMAYDRNGRDPTVGHATGAATSSNFSAPGASSSYYEQSFTGGSNGDGAIFYHPDNVAKNPQATNEAYYLYGNFWTKWNDLGGANTCGVPTRDWYMSRDPQNWGSPTEYKLQNFMRANGEQHYMILKNGVVEWHSSYNSDWVTQTPFVIDLVRGQTATFSVTYKNAGSTTWLGAGSDPTNPDRIELRACSPWPDGDVQDSWLWPGSGGGWISPSRVVTANQASIAPGQNATFTFTVKVPSNQSLGSDQRAYFRPYHTIGELIEEWDGYYVQVNVINPPAPAFGLILRNPTTAEWWARPSNGSTFYYPSGVNTPPDRWLNAWAQDGGGYTFTPYAGDPNGDGYDDLIVQRSDANWYVAWNNQNGSFTPQGQAILSPWGTGGYPGKYFFWFTNMNSDQKSELLTYDASNANWYVSTFNTTSNTYDSYSQWTSWGGGVGVFQPLVGDWNGDGKTDICLRNWSTGAHWVRLSSGTSFTQPNPDNWIVWGATGDPATFTPLAGDWDGDGKADILLFNPSSGDWYVRTSSGSAFVYPSGSNNPADRWQAGWTGSGYIPFVGDFNYDGKTDIGLRNPTLGDHWVRTSTGLAFSQPSPDNWQGGWGASSTFQLLTGRFGSGSPGGGYSMYEAPPDEGSNPGTFSFALWATPNPVTASTTLHFTLPGTAHVRLTIHDIHGRSVMSVPDRDYGPGPHAVIWNRNDPNGGRVSSGIYFARLSSNKYAITAKVVVVN